MTYEEAEAWCHRELAGARWREVAGTHRCVVSVPGHPALAERDTFTEAVSAAAAEFAGRRAVKRPALA